MKRMLIVDDEEAMLEVIRQSLEDRYDITTATSGVEAIQRFVVQRPDVVLLDINMPGTNGVEVLKILRETDPRIPVIIITANPTISAAADCLANGAFGYVPKPFDLAYMEHMAATATEAVSR